MQGQLGGVGVVFLRPGDAERLSCGIPHAGRWQMALSDATISVASCIASPLTPNIPKMDQGRGGTTYRSV